MQLIVVFLLSFSEELREELRGWQFGRWCFLSFLPAAAAANDLDGAGSNAPLHSHPVRNLAVKWGQMRMASGMRWIPRALENSS